MKKDNTHQFGGGGAKAAPVESFRQNKLTLTIKKQRKNGFSLAEMMVVLLIVAIVLAATAPMITRKISRERSDKIFDMLNSDPANAVEYVKGRNQRIYMNSRPNGYVGIRESGDKIPINSVLFGNNKYDTSKYPVNFVGIGFNTQNSKDTVVIGYNAVADDDGSIAIGNNAKVNKPSSMVFKHSRYSTAIGYNAHTKASRSTAIGYNASVALTAQSSTAIGYNAKAVYSHSVVLGTEDDTVYIPGNLIVGKTTFVGAKSVEDGKAYPLYIQAHYGHDGDGRAITDAIDLLERHWADDYKGGGDWAVAINGDRQPGVQLGEYKFLAPTSWGDMGDNQKICPPSINGNWRRISKGNCSYVDTSIDNKLIYSDIRLKNVSETFSGGLEELNKLKFYHFTFKNDKDKKPQVGIMAQDLQKVFPNAVTKNKDGWLQIRWDEMFYSAINAIKELNDKVIALSEKLQEFTTELTDLKAKVDKQQTEIETQAKKLNKQQQELENLSERIKKLEHKK